MDTCTYTICPRLLRETKLRTSKNSLFQFGEKLLKTSLKFKLQLGGGSKNDRIFHFFAKYSFSIQTGRGQTVNTYMCACVVWPIKNCVLRHQKQGWGERFMECRSADWKTVQSMHVSLSFK
jgi:hypothetical protein